MEFNESSITCSYIQNLLYNFYIPVINIVKSAEEYEEAQIGEHFITQDGGIYLKTKDGNEFISTYVPGNKYLGLTRNIVSESNNYNTELHEQLGNYIRFLRDYYKSEFRPFDLMPLYNCFSNRFIDSFSLPIIEERKKGSVVEIGTKLFAFPVRFGNNYSIFCKNNCQAQIQLAFFNGKKPLELYYPIENDEKKWIVFQPEFIQISQWEENIINIKTKEEYAEEINNSYQTDSKDIISKILRTNSVNLYLFVQLPEKNADNIVIIENNSTLVINNSLINNHLQKPFSDKLLGYLLNYYISPLDPIQENIEKYQKILSSQDFYVKDELGRRINENGAPQE